MQTELQAKNTQFADLKERADQCKKEYEIVQNIISTQQKIVFLGEELLWAHVIEAEKAENQAKESTVQALKAVKEAESKIVQMEQSGLDEQLKIKLTE